MAGHLATIQRRFGSGKTGAGICPFIEKHLLKEVPERTEKFGPVVQMRVERASSPVSPVYSSLVRI